jgi:hypothetical protein
MESFLAAFGHLVRGVLHGFDRLVFRGHLRQLSYAHGMECYLSANRVLLKDFNAHAIERTETLIDASLANANRLQRPIPYLNSSSISKEEEALRIAARDQVREGLICVFKCVEPCWTFEVHRNRERQMLELRGKQGKCSFLYHYFLHPTFGLMHVRLQTWFPYAMQVCLNGREWLAKQLDRAGLSYTRRDNKFTDVADFAKAQAFLNEQVRTPWSKRLNEITRQVHPSHPELLGRLPVDYYWSVYQSEWASDVVFQSRAVVEKLFPQWVRHAMTTYQSVDVMRFLGRTVPLSGRVHQGFEGEVSSKACPFEEGMRIKHWVNGNSIKMYDCDCVLRFETTINRAEEFKAFRPSETDPQGEKRWRTMRRGVADLHRRAEVSQAANERYATAAAAMRETTPLKEVAEPLSRRVPGPGKAGARKVRGLNPFSAKDGAVLEAVSDPKHMVSGLRNRDLTAMLYSRPARTNKEQRRRSACVTRWIRLLRAHGILQKVPRTHRYQVNSEARKIVTAILAARNASAEFLTSNAA